jgi:hypothetical protein
MKVALTRHVFTYSRLKKIFASGFHLLCEILKFRLLPSSFLDRAMISQVSRIPTYARYEKRTRELTRQREGRQLEKIL